MRVSEQYYLRNRWPGTSRSLLENTEGQVARWIQRLTSITLTSDIVKRPLGNADALSRRPCPENCRHCSRVETKYDYAIAAR
ncbi:hypothetical protein TNCV_4813921 [Trichonephila clavipes]|nr:hypothetical protein TNCV_4813921 [Trichonephila clavipes]